MSHERVEGELVVRVVVERVDPVRISDPPPLRAALRAPSPAQHAIERSGLAAC